jgi:hypothetical protein
MNTKLTTIGFLGAMILAGTAYADSMHMAVKAQDQSVSGGTVTASEIMAQANGWLVVHRTDAAMKPGPLVGHAPLKNGANREVTAILTEPVQKGEMLMLMLHGEDGGMKTGIFEYTLGAKEDGPVKVDGKLVMTVITAL